MSRRIALLAVLVYGILIAGLISLNGKMIALIFPLILYLVAGWYFGSNELKLSVHRTIDTDYISSGETLVVHLTIENQGAPIDELMISEKLPASLKLVDGKASEIISLGHNQIYEMCYTVEGKRGSFSLEQVTLTACECFGLISKSIIDREKTQFEILPEVKRINRVVIRPRRTHDYVGQIPARQGGSGVEFFGVREYQVGDPLRWINWKVTARHQQDLYTNEFEQERIAEVGLILDARALSDIPDVNGSLFEYSVQVTASMADAFLNDGNRVGLLIYGRGQEKTFPGYGKVQRERILRALGKAQTSNNMALQSLEYLPTRFFPAHSQIVLISPLCDSDLPVLFRLRALGYSLLIISPDPVAFEANRYTPEDDVQTGFRIAYLERALLLHKLQRVGIQTVDWNVATPFNQVAQACLGRLSLGQHAIGSLL